MRIGKYNLVFGRVFWLQTQAPIKIRHFLLFWVYWDAKPTDVDKKKEFSVGTRMMYEGRVFKYWRADRDYRKGECVRKTSDDCRHDTHSLHT